MELTHLRESASSTGNPWRWCVEIVKGGRSERDLRNERGGIFDPGHSQGIGHCPEHGTAIPERAGSGCAQAAAAKGIQAGPVQRVHGPAALGRAGELCGAVARVARVRIPGGLLPGEDLCVATPPPAPGSGDGAVRDRAGGTSPGGLGKLQLRGRTGSEAANVGLRDGAQLVSGHLRGVRPESRHGQLHPVPRQRLRLPGRSAQAMPV